MRARQDSVRLLDGKRANCAGNAPSRRRAPAASSACDFLGLPRFTWRHAAARPRAPPLPTFGGRPRNTRCQPGHGPARATAAAAARRRGLPGPPTTCPRRYCRRATRGKLSITSYKARAADSSCLTAVVEANSAAHVGDLRACGIGSTRASAAGYVHGRAVPGDDDGDGRGAVRMWAEVVSPRRRGPPPRPAAPAYEKPATLLPPCDEWKL